MTRHDRPDPGLRAGRRLAARLVHPAGRAAGDATADGRPERQRDAPAAVGGAVTATYLDRLAARSRGRRERPVPRARPDPASAARRASRATSPASSGSRALLVEAAGAVRRGGQAEPRLLRGVRVGRAGRPRADPREPARRPAGRRSTPSAATSARPPPARPSPCSTGSAPTRSRSTRTSGSEAHRAAARAARTGSPTSCAGPRTRARPSSRTSSSRPTRRPARRPSRSTCGVARRAADLGSGRHGRPGRRGDRTRPSSRAIRAVAPGLAVPRARASAPRAASSTRCWRDGPATAAPAAAGPAAACSSTSRAASPARPSASPTPGSAATSGSASRRPPRDWAARLPVLP